VYEVVRLLAPLGYTLTGIAAYKEQVYVGTSDGTLIVYRVTGWHASLPLMPLCLLPCIVSLLLLACVSCVAMPTGVCVLLVAGRC
jgi:hypothetical protein